MFNKIASTFLIKIGVAILNLLLVIIISQSLGAEGKGDSSLIITSIALIIFFCNIIGGDSLVYLAPRYNLFQLIILSTIWTIIVCLIALFIFKKFEFLPPNFVVPIIVLAFINSLFSTNIVILIGKNKAIQTNWISLIQSIISVVLLLVLIYIFHKNNIDSFIDTIYLSYFTALIISSILILKFINSFSLKNLNTTLNQMLNVGFSNQLGHIFQFVSLRLSFYLLNYYNGKASLGVYSNGTSIAESLWLISNSIALIQYSSIANSSDLNQSQTITKQLVRFSIWACLFVSMCFLFIPSELYITIFGKEFYDVKLIILLLLPGVIFNNIFLIISHYFSGTGNYLVSSIANLIGLFITLSFSISVIFFNRNYGIVAAAIISSVSYFATAGFIIVRFNKTSNSNLTFLIPKLEDIKFIKQKAVRLLLKN